MSHNTMLSRISNNNMLNVIWVVTRLIYLGITVMMFDISDVPLYCEYAGKVFEGQVPYLDFLFEYPPGVLPFILLPRLLTGSLFWYQFFFALEMFCIDFFCFKLIIKYLEKNVFRGTGRYLGQILCLILPLLLWSLPYSRYDFIPTAFTLAVLICWQDKKYFPGWFLLGLAFAIKLYPLVLVPLFALIHWKEKSFKSVLAGGIFFMAAVAVCWGPFLLMAGSKFWVFLSYHKNRGIQLESLYATCVMLARGGGYPVEIDYSFGSFNLVSGISSFLARSSLFLGGLIQVAVFFRAWQVSYRKESSARELPGLIIISILGFIITGKVFSPQYLLWIFPFLPLAVPSCSRPKLIFVLSIVSYAFSSFVFPLWLDELRNLELVPWIVLTFRNVTVCLMFILLFRDLDAPDFNSPINQERIFRAS